MRPEFDRTDLQNLFMALVERIPQLVWTAGDDGRWTWASQGWTSHTGLSDEASKEYGWQTAIYPSDRAAMVSGWRNAAARGEIDVEHRLVGAGLGGKARWFNTHSAPIANPRGTGTIWLGTCTDIDDAKLLNHRQRQRQLERRVVNVVALTRLVSRRTAKADESLENYTLHLDSRLDAIARLQTMMLRDPQAGVELAAVVIEELLAHAVHESEQVHVAGPAVRLCGAAADLICLTIHELAMNAVEHGAFVVPLGRLAVTWAVEATASGGTLRIEWRESGSPVADSAHRLAGFGTELIERVLCQQLAIVASLRFGHDGVRCVINVPLADNVLIPEPRRSGLRRPI